MCDTVCYNRVNMFSMHFRQAYIFHSSNTAVCWLSYRSNCLDCCLGWMRLWMHILWCVCGCLCMRTVSFFFFSFFNILMMLWLKKTDKSTKKNSTILIFFQPLIMNVVCSSSSYMKPKGRGVFVEILAQGEAEFRSEHASLGLPAFDHSDCSNYEVA